MTPEEKREKEIIDMLKFDYENLHTSMWENHRTSWVVSGIMIPVIFTLEGLFIKSYFEKEDFTISWQYIFIFVVGAILIQSLAVIWWLVMNAFHDLNKKRISRLVEIERILCNRKDLLKDCKLVDHYYCLYCDKEEYEVCEKGNLNPPKKDSKHEKENLNCASERSSLLFVLLGLTFSMLTEHYKCTLKKVEDRKLNKIMKIYSLVVLIPFSLNFIILIYLIIWIIGLSIQVEIGT